LRLVAVNNYKDKEKFDEFITNLKRSTDSTIDLIDYRTSNLKDRVEALNPDAVVLSGSNYMLTKPDTRLVFEHEIDMIGKLRMPIIGVCYGHQLIGSAFGSSVVDLGQTIRAMKDVNILQKDPVFDSLPRTIRVSESHRQALSKLPEGFQLLAESASCKVEAMVHQTRPIYGFQFHPERWDEKYPYGRTLIENFLKIVSKKKQASATSGLATTISHL
jgi:GMP synthase (glutamine-hydrolysing)